MKIYLAARYSRKKEMTVVSKKLTKLGHVITSEWIHPIERAQSNEDKNMWALIDLSNIEMADTIICFTESEGVGGSGGRHVEMGYALALRKCLNSPVERVIIIGPLENVFCHLEGVERYNSLNQMLTESKAFQGIFDPT